MSYPSAIATLFEAAFGRWRRYRADVRTRKAVCGLSHRMRKDIGWPEALPDHPGRRNPPDSLGS